MKELEDLQLTEGDFKLLTDGLDALPNAGQGGEILSTIFEAMLTNRKKNEKAKSAAKAMQIEEVRSFKDTCE